MGGAPTQTRSGRVLKQPIEPPLSEGYTSRSGEGMMEHQFELTANVAITPHDSTLPEGYTPGSDKDKGSQAPHNQEGGNTDSKVFDDEDVTMAMAQTLIKMKEVKAKEKGVEFINVEEASRHVISITTLQPLLKIDLKDKELDRAQIERQRQEEATNAALTEEFDKIQARIDAVKKDNKIGIKILYHGFHKKGSEKEVQESGKILKRVAGSYATQNSPKKPKVMKSVKNVIEEEAAEYEKEKEELRLSLKIISGDEIEVNYEPLSRRFPIMNWEYKLLGNVDAKDIYEIQLTRADGSSSYHGDMQAFLRRLDRQDLNDLYRLVQERFQDHPLEGHDLLLWGDLRMLFDQDEKDKL
ncbi:hypothetical protein Tco_0309414 [Tanacetum coccineum]